MATRKDMPLRQHSSRFLMARLTGAVTVWTVLTLGANAAWASCGDYLQHPRHEAMADPPAMPENIAEIANTDTPTLCTS